MSDGLLAATASSCNALASTELSKVRSADASWSDSLDRCKARHDCRANAIIALFLFATGVSTHFACLTRWVSTFRM